MARLLLAVTVLFGLVNASAAQERAARIAPRPLASALHAADAGRWEVAVRLALRAGPAAVALIEWERLREGLGTPADILAFLAAHPGWPDGPDLHRRGEGALVGADTATVLSYFKGRRARTGTGALAHARALLERGQTGEAEAELVLAWRTLDLTPEEHDAFIAAHGPLLEPHHEARLDMALWRGLRDVDQMLPLAGETARALAEARRKIAKGDDVDDASLPEGGAQNAGIAYERFIRHVRAGRSEAAIALILQQSLLPDGLGEPDRWGGWRRYLARAEMREGRAETAYRLAAIHQLVEGRNYADLEWLAGYLALAYLEAPQLALDHFQRFRAAVDSPISLGRAGYWIGRAQEALGDPEAAAIAYGLAARHQTSFYGLLAAGRAGIAPDTALSGKPPDGEWRNADFVRSPLFQVGLLLRAEDRPALAERFFVALAGTLDAGGVAGLGQALDELDEPHLQVMVGKEAAKSGLVVPAPYYALHPLSGMDLPVPAELALAIARRESEFDPGVQSAAGAQGLMQLMPGTARDMARALGIAHDRARVLADWRYNARLGAAYLAGLVRRFDGNVVMVAAGYNAGPGRPLQWIEARGDPRGGTEEEIVDWIEHIPFRETRNYVMRVAESLPVYRARLGRDPLPVPFARELAGSTLRAAALD